ncbi:MAG: sulfotransferase [Pyrinomonadaceae bacterium]
MAFKVDIKMEAAQLRGWMPVRLYWQQSRPMVDWCYLGTRRFTEPFFEQTIDECLRRPFNLLFRHQTPVEALAQSQEFEPGLSPTGLIFHMSRCGSTLVTQMLASLPQNIVISEAGTIDTVLRANFLNAGVTGEQQLDWLRWMVSALARRRHEQESHLFIKFDSWHTLSMPLILRAFPGVPWIFVCRDPLEVIVSHVRHPSGRMLSGMAETHLLGLDMTAITRMPLEEYCAMVLARICETALRHQRTSAGTIIDYTQLPEAVCSLLPDVFRVAYSASDLETMRHTSLLNAKAPPARFADDTEAKRSETTDAIRQAADKWVGPLYQQLKNLCHH